MTTPAMPSTSPVQRAAVGRSLWSKRIAKAATNKGSAAISVPVSEKVMYRIPKGDQKKWVGNLPQRQDGGQFPPPVQALEGFRRHDSGTTIVAAMAQRSHTTAGKARPATATLVKTYALPPSTVATMNKGHVRRLITISASARRGGADIRSLAAALPADQWAMRLVAAAP
jgi:hypothetical protein